MKFKIDENVPVELVQTLSASGHDAKTVLEQALKGANDPFTSSELSPPRGVCPSL